MNESHTNGFHPAADEENRFRSNSEKYSAPTDNLYVITENSINKSTLSQTVLDQESLKVRMRNQADIAEVTTPSDATETAPDDNTGQLTSVRQHSAVTPRGRAGNTKTDNNSLGNVDGTYIKESNDKIRALTNQRTKATMPRKNHAHSTGDTFVVGNVGDVSPRDVSDKREPPKGYIINASNERHQRNGPIKNATPRNSIKRKSVKKNDTDTDTDPNRLRRQTKGSQSERSHEHAKNTLSEPDDVSLSRMSLDLPDSPFGFSTPIDFVSQTPGMYLKSYPASPTMISPGASLTSQSSLSNRTSMSQAHFSNRERIPHGSYKRRM